VECPIPEPLLLAERVCVTKFTASEIQSTSSGRGQSGTSGPEAAAGPVVLTNEAGMLDPCSGIPLSYYFLPVGLLTRGRISANEGLKVPA
jgi:hypothetical protein